MSAMSAHIESLLKFPKASSKLKALNCMQEINLNLHAARLPTTEIGEKILHCANLQKNHIQVIQLSFFIILI